MTEELCDLSGPFNPNLKFEGFFKEFLLKIMNVWQFVWIRMPQAYYDLIREQYGFESANEINEKAWTKTAATVNPRYPKVVNIQLNTVLDSPKCRQLPPDNTIGPLYPVEYYIKNHNHVIINNNSMSLSVIL